MEALDDDGYPTPQAMLQLEDARPLRRAELEAAFALAETMWNHTYGRFERDGDKFTLATGGWSGNEDVIGSLHGCFTLWSRCWVSSHRGGLHRFELPEGP